MKRIQPKRLSRRGFTLVEVVVSVGLLAFAILVILGSLGYSGRLAANDARRTQAVELLHSCFRDLDPARNPGGGSTPVLKLAPLAWPSKVRLWFDAEGNPVPDAQQAFFKCDLSAVKDASAPLGHLHGRIVWPAKRTTGSPDGDAELFTSLMLP